MIFESFGISILNALGIPPGASIRKGTTDKSSSSYDVSQSDLINSIVEITSDDVCLGSSPLYFSCEKELTTHHRKKVDLIIAELNSIVKWVAIDLLKHGISLYEIKKSTDNNLLIFPLIGEFELYLDDQKKIHVYRESDDSEIKDIIIFLNYDKPSLEEIEEKSRFHTKFKFKINPSPIQLKNISTIARDLNLTESAINRYRRQISKMVRIISVDIGVSQGTAQQDVIDTISSSINADSSSFDNPGMFDDAIPVVPTRKGLGKPELTESTNSFDIKELADLDYNLGKLYLALRFPKSYADFNTALDGTAVSTIRGDIRYSRLVDYTRSIIIDSINDLLSSSPALKGYGPMVSLTELPTPEDEDVVAAIDTFTDLTKSVFEFVMDGTEDKEEAKLKLEMLLTLLKGVTSFKYIIKWTDLMYKYIDNHFDKVDEGGSGSSDNDSFDDGLGGDGPLDMDEMAPTDFGNEVEELEEQTEE